MVALPDLKLRKVTRSKVTMRRKLASLRVLSQRRQRRRLVRTGKALEG